MRYKNKQKEYWECKVKTGTGGEKGFGKWRGRGGGSEGLGLAKTQVMTS